MIEGNYRGCTRAGMIWEKKECGEIRVKYQGQGESAIATDRLF